MGYRQSGAKEPDAPADIRMLYHPDHAMADLLRASASAGLANRDVVAGAPPQLVVCGSYFVVTARRST